MQIAVAASAGRSSLSVRPRPRVVVLSTGDELSEPGTPLVPGRIWDSNSYMIAALAREAGAVAYRHSGLPDDVAGVLPAITEQLIRADLVITTGGVSMGGTHDVVKAALSELGTVQFRKIAMQPGMPQGFGLIGPDSVPIFFCPGIRSAPMCRSCCSCGRRWRSCRAATTCGCPRFPRRWARPCAPPRGGGRICAGCSPAVPREPAWTAGR
jgi:molybdenum cofactor synthesis domain-containing protein